MVQSFECFLRECAALRANVRMLPVLVGTNIRFTAIARHTVGSVIKWHRIDCEVRGEQAISLQFPAGSERRLDDHFSAS